MSRLAICSVGLTIIVAAVGASGGDPRAAAAPAGVVGPATRYAPGMLEALAKSDGVTPAEAAQRLDRQKDLLGRYDELKKRGTAVDGSFLDKEGNLVVNISSDDAAAQVTSMGLIPRRGMRGERSLIATFQAVRKVIAAYGYKYANTWEVLIPSDVVSVDLKTSTDGQAAELRRKLDSMPGVQVTLDQFNPTPSATAVGGRTMSGLDCTLGFNGNRGGNSIMYTVGHCVEDAPNIYDGNGSLLGKGAGTEFHTGELSRDFGQIDIMTGVGQWISIDTHRDSPNTYITITNTTRVYTAGFDICKTGKVSGWTCGDIRSGYTEVVYPLDTPVYQIASAYLCNEDGDSGGPMVHGTTGIGMVAAKSKIATCGWNLGRYRTDVITYFVYVDDVQDWYGGLVLQTS